MFGKEIVIVETLKRAKLLTRKTGKTTIHRRNGFVKIVLPLFKPTLIWEILKTYNFLKVIKITHKRKKGNKTRGLLIISILTAKDSKQLWHFIFSKNKFFNLTFDDKNLNVRNIRRQMLRGKTLLPFDERIEL